MTASGKLCCSAKSRRTSRPECGREFSCSCIGRLCPQSRRWKPIFWCTCSERQLRPRCSRSNATGRTSAIGRSCPWRPKCRVDDCQWRVSGSNRSSDEKTQVTALSPQRTFIRPMDAAAQRMTALSPKRMSSLSAVNNAFGRQRCWRSGCWLWRKQMGDSAVGSFLGNDR